MSKKTRRRFDALKAKVALEIAEQAAKYQLRPNQIYAWKKQLLDGAAGVFSGGASKEGNREVEVCECRASPVACLDRPRPIDRFMMSSGSAAMLPSNSLVALTATQSVRFSPRASISSISLTV